MKSLEVRPKPIVLVVVDGFGIAPENPGNAVALAKTPNLDKYAENYPHTTLHASGEYVGLSKGVDGNSEVGHMTIGIGKAVMQEVLRIDNSINSDNFHNNPKLVDAIKHAKEHDSNLHVIGLIGGGQVHSALNHAYAVLDMCVEHNFNGNRVFFHVITDGRDSGPYDAPKFLKKLEAHMNKTSVGYISTLIGRHYAMDRDERWERTKKAYDLMVEAKGQQFTSWEEAFDKYYAKETEDQYIEPTVLLNYDTPFPSIQSSDSVIFLNFRGDRAVQLTMMFEDPKLKVERKLLRNVYFVGLSDYAFGFPKNAAYPKEKVAMNLGKFLSQNKLTQLRAAESEKFPHVTYFFSGENEQIYAGEDRIEIQSPKNVKTYDKSPKMNAEKLTEIVVNKIDSNKYDFILVNYANVDMVAHTGKLKPTIKAIETVDKMLGDLVENTLDKGGVIIITSDHGNAEELYSSEGGIDTKHSNNKVPFIIIGNGLDNKRLRVGTLADIAPTIIHLLNLEKPIQMEGSNLLE